MTAIETGHRDVALEEFLLLPYVLSHRPFEGAAESPRDFTELADLLPEKGFVALTPEFSMQAHAVRRLLRGKASEVFGSVPKRERKPEGIELIVAQEMTSRAKRELEEKYPWLRALFPYATQQQMDEAKRGEAGEAEQKVGRKFGVPALVVAFAALRLWSRTLTQERDRQVFERSFPGAAPRTLQAIRGHVTRELADRLLPVVVELQKLAGRPKRWAVRRAKKDNRS